MPRQGISWEPIAVVSGILMFSLGLIFWGLSSPPESPTSKIENPVVNVGS